MDTALIELTARKNEAITGAIVVCDCDDNAVADVTVTVEISGEGRERTTDARGLAVWSDVKDQQTLTLKSRAVSADISSSGSAREKDASAAVPFTFTPVIGGTYSLTFTATDSDGTYCKERV